MDRISQLTPAQDSRLLFHSVPTKTSQCRLCLMANVVWHSSFKIAIATVNGEATGTVGGQAWFDDLRLIKA